MSVGSNISWSAAFLKKIHFYTFSKNYDCDISSVVVALLAPKII